MRTFQVDTEERPHVSEFPLQAAQLKIGVPWGLGILYLPIFLFNLFTHFPLQVAQLQIGGPGLRRVQGLGISLFAHFPI
jgi:hypothetical protein